MSIIIFIKDSSFDDYMIKLLIEKKPEEKQNATGKIIKIETIRYPIPRDSYGDELLRYMGIASNISFSHPIKDYKGKEHKKIELSTMISTGAFGQHFFWGMALDDGFLIDFRTFGELKEPYIRSYSREYVREWEENALKKHRQMIQQIEDLFYEGKEIPKMSK